MSLNILQMEWLPPVVGDFRAQVRALREAEYLDFSAARRLATQRLDLSQMHTLARGLDERVSGDAVPRVSLSVLSNTTVDFLAPAVKATAPRHGILLEAHVPTFGTFATEALDLNSETNRRRDDFVLLALDHRSFNFEACPGDRQGAETVVASAISQLRGFTSSILAAGAKTVLVQTLAPPATPLFGSLDRQIAGSLRWMIDAFNSQLCDSMPMGVLIFDVAALAEIVGLAQWHDPVQWNLGKFSFSQHALPLYAEWLCRLIAASKGKSRKCLVLDLDNTLWGGVIGDDGINGVVLGQGSALGESFLAVQMAALSLRNRGVILAVSSKNDDATARKMFLEHPEMLLREEHIAVFQANWQDKASNLRAIAETLNIGIDSLVLLDDNPAEREQVRAALPEVAVPELPEHPDYYANILLAAGYFESAEFTQDDLQRAEQYRANAARRAQLGTATDLEAYLASLEMEAHVSAFDDLGRARITQLINKTNQFNLTTKRYSESQVAELAARESVIDLQIRLKDKFGDNGMISVVIAEEERTDLRIDTWLMSCRVLNRRVEYLVLNVLITIARKRRLQRLVGTYCPTDRNGLVRDLYARLGFQHISESVDAVTWGLNVNEFLTRAVPINLVIGENIALEEL